MHLKVQGHIFTDEKASHRLGEYFSLIIGLYKSYVSVSCGRIGLFFMRSLIEGGIIGVKLNL